MRALSTHLTPMDRQITESLNIILEARKPGNCLNLKSEWAGAKIPGLQVSTPKGVSRGRKQEEVEEETQPQQEILAEAGEGGAKRIRDAQSTQAGNIEEKKDS